MVLIDFVRFTNKQYLRDDSFEFILHPGSAQNK